MQGQCALNVLYIFTTVNIASVLYNRPHWPSFFMCSTGTLRFWHRYRAVASGKVFNVQSLALLYPTLDQTGRRIPQHQLRERDHGFELLSSDKIHQSPPNPPTCPSVSPSPPTLEYCILQAKLTVPAPSLLLNTLSFPVSAFQCLSP